jgi:hypothetical protein
MAVERFKDEWLVRLLSRNPLIPPGFVDQPRQMSAAALQDLRDLGQLVERELMAGVIEAA